MGRPYDHQYLTVPGARCGTMQCGGCGKPITEGEFRAYKRSKGGDWGFVTHHRACCADDAGWAKRDRARDDHAVRLESIAADVRKLLASYPAGYAGVIHEELTEQMGAA